jgi:hypothetical protein
MKDITFNHDAENFVEALGIKHNETGRQFETLIEMTDKLEGKINRSKLAELIAKNVDKEVILLFATEYVLAKLTDDPMEKMLKMLGQMRDSLKD